MAAEKRYTPPRYIQVLKEIRRMIDEDYPDGGPFPTAREMCARFNLSSVTYMKIFKILQNEGVLRVEGRSGGTRVVPESGRAVKIGVIFSMESNPYIKANSFPLKVIHRLSMSGIGIHILTAHDPHQLYNLCAQFSFRFLLWFHPSEQQLARIAKSGVDLPLIVFDHYSHKLKSYPFPYIASSFDFRCRTLAEFLRERQFGKPLYCATFSGKSLFGREIIRIFKEYGFDLGEKDFANISHPEELLREVRKSRCRIVIAESPAWLLPPMHEALRQIPEEERPKLLLFFNYEKAAEFVRIKAPERPDFWFQVDNPRFMDLVSQTLMDCLENGLPRKGIEFNVTSIIPGKR